jgi:hypothetical protein
MNADNSSVANSTTSCTPLIWNLDILKIVFTLGAAVFVAAAVNFGLFAHCLWLTLVPGAHYLRAAHTHACAVERCYRYCTISLIESANDGETCVSASSDVLS